MNFISNFFKKKDSHLNKKIKIIAPISGKIIPIEKVPDIVFAQKVVGDGVAIKPTSKYIVSPIDGKLGTIFKTLHAFSIESIEGVQIFVHFGIDTVKLKGKGFKAYAKEGQIVKKGDIILKVNLKLLKKTAKSLITPIIISNVEKIKIIEKKEGMIIAGKSVIMYVHKK
ncbi:PTS glucose transporter subunit IIA [Buchnera aphidicola]|uniref:PTS glucose transporter subunit IIA n=1 Tax=Buchnera aphidicola TaxID=9 RepID=UPI00223700A6|nr:PTS glucose transporter subunit IIA [Buchnera aphidicola]MCW5197377.1 PTS glucose transporter subunit IIA [Buchnera aphidicola (Chaitophorus viminalis)]